MTTWRSVLLGLAVLSCGAPTGAPTRIADVNVSESTPEHWRAMFRLYDASGAPTTASGTLAFSVRDASGAEICRLTEIVSETSYDADRQWLGHVTAAPTPSTCPPVGLTETGRTVVLELTTDGRTIAGEPVHDREMFRSAPPSATPASPPPAAPSPEPVPSVELAAPGEADGWIVAPALGARVNAPGARVVSATRPPMGASDVLIIGTSDACRVQLARWPTLAVTGATVRERAREAGDPIIVDDVTPERWHLEHEHAGYRYVSVGIVEADGATAIVCRADYPLGESESVTCAATICASLTLDSVAP